MSKKSKNIPPPKTISQYNRLVLQGTKYYDKGEFTEALRYFGKAIDFEAYNPNVLILMSKCLFGLGMKSKAIQLMEHALHQSAGNPSICEALGNACVSMGFTELAVQFFTLFVQLDPNHPTGYNNLSTALRENGQLDESIQVLQDIIPIFPDNPYLWNTLGAGVSYRDGYVAAEPFYAEAYRLAPKVPMIASNMCLVYTSLGQYEKAWEMAKKSVQLAPNNAELRLAVSHRSLTVGKFEDAFEAMGWHNHHTLQGSVFMPYQIDKWQGESLEGKTILIGAEQGIGDEVLFSSLYPQIIEEAAHVIIGCDKRLVPLFKNSFKEATILPYVQGQHETGYQLRLYEELEPEKIDYMCLYIELMRYKWRSVEDIPDMSAGFLTPPQDRIEFWKDRVSKLPNGLNIGICWRSGLKQAKRQMFYATLLEWAPVLKTKNVNFINVQYGECTEELKELEELHGIKIHNFEDLDIKDDFENTAALMKNLDLVIGPGTSPLAQSATAGTTTWWVNYNHRPWWSFGFDKGSPLFPEFPTSIKPPTLNWAEYLPLFAEEEFQPWVAEKLKEKSA